MKTYNGKVMIGESPKGIQLGNIVAAGATPIAKILKLNCIDKDTKQLKPESRCQKWKDKLNR